MTIEIGCLHGRYLRTLGADPLTSARRIDFYDDPAPRASALVPSVNIVVADGAGGIVLIRRTDKRQLGAPRRCDRPRRVRRPGGRP
jgi:hypothetical protein